MRFTKTLENKDPGKGGKGRNKSKCRGQNLPCKLDPVALAPMV